MKPFFLPTFILALCSAQLFAQGKINMKPAKVSIQDFTLPVSPAIDSSTNAVIISDIGVTDFTGNKQGWFSYVFKRKTRIKILNKKAFELATVRIPLYVRGEDKEVVTEIAAVTSNLENGQVVETKTEKADLFTETEDKNHIEQKFTMPAVKEGSIIEYSYTVTSDFNVNLAPWEFQNLNYPCLWSEYQVTIPSLLAYVFNRYGVHSFSIDKEEEGHGVYLLTKPADQRNLGTQDETYTVNTITVKHRWVMKDVPAFHVESFLFAPANYIDKISFQLHKTYDGETYHDYMPTWAKATEMLLKEERFGLFMYGEENNYWMNEILDAVVKNGTGVLRSAKDIYYLLCCPKLYVYQSV